MTNPSILHLLQYGGAPEDCLHSILSFAGARATSSLSQVSAFWRDVGSEDRVWASLCASLGKDRSSAATWREAFCLKILVPQDIPTLEQAVKFCNYEFQRAANANVPKKHMTILLKPGHTYQVEEPLIVQAVGENARLGGGRFWGGADIHYPYRPSRA